MTKAERDAMPLLKQNLGRNIRPGMTPGGFTRALGVTGCKQPYRKKNPTYQQIRDVAKRVLEKRPD